MDRNTLVSFIVLSNLALDECILTLLINDYQTEKNDTRTYFYEYFLAKRIQEKKHILDFIEGSNHHLDFLSRNNTDWASVANPFYELLAYYANTNDTALEVLFKLYRISDGAGLSTVDFDLSQQHSRNRK